MTEQLIAFVLGFILGYLIVKIIRSFRTVGMCFTIMLLSCNVKAGPYHYTVSFYGKNSGGSTINYSFGSSSGTPNSGRFTTLTAGQTKSLDVEVSAASYHDTFTLKADGVVKFTFDWDNDCTFTGGESYSLTGHTTEGTALEFSSTQYTNYPGTVYLTNGTLHLREYRVTAYKNSDNSIIWTTQVSLPAGTDYTGEWTFQYPWHWDSQILFEWDDSGNPIPGPGGTNSTPNTGTNNIPPTTPPIPSPTPTPGDALGTNYPGPHATNLTTTNIIVAERQNTLALIDAINELAKTMMKQTMVLTNSVWNTGTNGGGNGTNIDYRPYWTNLLGPDYATIINDWSNNVGVMEGIATNEANSEWTNSGMSGMTNFSSLLTGTNVTGNTGNLQVVLGTVGNVTHVVDFDLGRVSSWNWVMADALLITDWAGKILAQIIAWGLWAYCIYRLDELRAEIEWAGRVGMGMGSGAGGGSIAGTVMKYLSRLTLRGVIATLIFGTISALPTILIAVMQNFWPTAPQYISTPMQDVNNNSMNVSGWMIMQMRYWWNMISRSIPYGTIMMAIANWFTFYLLSRRIAIVLSRVIWAKTYIAPLIAIMFLVIEVKASEVTFENYTGADVQMSNSTERVIIPVGKTPRIVMDTGTWNIGTNTVSIGDDCFNCVRILKAKADESLTVVTSGNGYTILAVFFLGMKLGLVFGFLSMAVRFLIDGLRLRHGGI